MATGRRAVLRGAREVRFERAEVPDPGPGELRIRVEGCGVCGSDLPVWEGRPWFEYPWTPGGPGHEGWGTVESVGPGVEGFAPGDRVAGLSFHAYADYDLAPADSAVKLPPALDGKPFPGEALACAMNVFRRSRVEPGQTVAVVGVGFLGSLLTALCAREGARVIALSRRPFALEVARSLGAAEAVAMDDHGRILERVRGLTDDRWCDRVIEATGRQWPLDLGAELCRVRGTLVIAGYHQDGPRQVNMQLWNWRGLDVVNAHERDPQEYVRGLRDGVEAAARGLLDTQLLCTHAFPLEELSRAFETMAARPDGFLKAVVRP